MEEEAEVDLRSLNSVCLFGMDFPGCDCNEAVDPFSLLLLQIWCVCSGLPEPEASPLNLPECTTASASGPGQPDTPLQSPNFQCGHCQSGSFKLKSLMPTICQCF